MGYCIIGFCKTLQDFVSAFAQFLWSSLIVILGFTVSLIDLDDRIVHILHYISNNSKPEVWQTLQIVEELPIIII